LPAARASSPRADAEALTAECRHTLARHKAYVLEHLDDIPEIRDWSWTDR